MRDPKKNSSNSQESDPDVCYAPPGKKSRLVWQGELHHHQFVKAVNVMQVGLDSMINSSTFIFLFSYN